MTLQMKHVIMYVEEIRLGYCKFSYIEIIILLFSFVGYASKKRQIKITLHIVQIFCTTKKGIFMVLAKVSQKS